LIHLIKGLAGLLENFFYSANHGSDNGQKHCGEMAEITRQTTGQPHTWRCRQRPMLKFRLPNL